MRPEIRKAIIRSVLKDQPASAATLPDAFGEALAAAEKILDARRGEHLALAAEQQRHREAVEAIERRCLDQKSTCRHWSWTTSTGPYERSLKTCDICGRDLP